MTNVVWLSFHEDVLARGYWDDALLEDLLSYGEYKHFYTTADVPEGEGAIVKINGRTHTSPEDIEKINEEINRLPWVLFMETGDEESLFPWREIKHPLMKVWIMLPKLNMHDDVAFRMPNGYTTDTRKYLREIGRKERDIDVSFVGQKNHPRRDQCVEALDGLQGYSKFRVATDAFGKLELNREEYMDILARSKVVLCPSGVESPDNFRLYEALEAGCVPIVDAFSTKHQAPGFWGIVLGDDLPFPIVNYWDELPAVLPELIANWTEISNKCYAWWQFFKRNMRVRLEDDVKELAR